MATARLVLVRHCETVWNVEGRLQGHLDSELTPRGLRQLPALAERIRQFRPAALYSSDLGRALKTAEAIGQACDLSVTLEVSLRERHLGVFQGLTKVEIQAQHPEAWQAFQTHGPDYVIPQGESARQRFERGAAGLRQLAERHPEQVVVAVTHGGTLNTAFRLVTGLALEAPRTFAMRNASINLIEYQHGHWELLTWGDISHLDMKALDDDG